MFICNPARTSSLTIAQLPKFEDFEKLDDVKPLKVNITAQVRCSLELLRGY